MACRGSGDRGETTADAGTRGTEDRIGCLLQKMSAGIGRHQYNPVLVSTDVGFVDSASEPLAQTVDMSAYTIYRSCRGDVVFRDLFNALVPRMWRHGGVPDGYGIKHYPDRG